MSAKIYVIVNADDFGMSPGVNRGIMQTHEYGIVTSASLLVHWPAATEAAAYSRRHENFSVGIHVDLGEWGFRQARWSPNYQRVNLKDAKAVEKEVASQLALFLKLVGKAPTHLDSHQHVHHREPVHAILLQLANMLKIPLRSYSNKIHYCGKFYGQTAEGNPLPEALSVSSLMTILQSLPSGYTELGCHPGEATDVQTDYREERLQEMKILCHPQIRKTLQVLHIQLCSFHTLNA
ncbi:MAG: ChbG/HpnK family deacetylase [Nitrospirota bacterium]